MRDSFVSNGSRLCPADSRETIKILIVTDNLRDFPLLHMRHGQGVFKIENGRGCVKVQGTEASALLRKLEAPQGQDRQKPVPDFTVTKSIVGTRRRQHVGNFSDDGFASKEFLLPLLDSLEESIAGISLRLVISGQIPENDVRIQKPHEWFSKRAVFSALASLAILVISSKFSGFTTGYTDP